MKIALIKQKTGYMQPTDADTYFSNVEEILKDSGADILIGPELAVSTAKDSIKREQLDKRVKNLASKLGENHLVIPGTGIVVDYTSNKMTNSAPIIFKDIFFYLNKRTSHEEDNIAKSKGLEYIRGGSNEGVFNFKNLKFGLEICRDHGHAKLKNSGGVYDCDYHIILAHNLSGVNPEKTVVKDGGIVLLNDGGSYNGVSSYRRKDDGLVELEMQEKENYALIGV